MLSAAAEGAGRAAGTEAAGAEGACEAEAARMVPLPTAVLRVAHVLIGQGTLSQPRWAGLNRYLESVLRADAKAAGERREHLDGEALVGRGELCERWQEMHTGFALSRVSQMRPPIDVAAFKAALDAAAKGDTRTVLSWVDGGGAVNAQSTAGGSTLVQRASAGGHVGLLKELIAQGARVNLQDDEGSTALHAAAHMGNVAVVQLLLRAQAAIDVCDGDGETPLEWARERGHADVVALLQEQRFQPLHLRGLLDRAQVSRLCELRGTLTTKVHDDGAGHEVIFLHAAAAKGQLSAECAALFATLVEAMRRHDPRSGSIADELSVRCVELHHYSVGAGLMDAGHVDSGSSLTMSVMLTEPTSLQGGEFVTWDGNGAPVLHRLGQGDAILFRSEDVHNVRPVLAGTRQTLIIELWMGKANRIDRNR
jgi:hypothetical protein